MIGMLKYEEQNALAGFCCFNEVTSLVTAGHRAGAGVVAGTPYAIVWVQACTSECLASKPRAVLLLPPLAQVPPEHLEESDTPAPALHTYYFRQQMRPYHSFGLTA